MINVFTEWFNDYLLPCPSKYFLNMDCPGCGLQRSVIALFQGDLTASLTLYPATLPILITMIFSVLHIKYDFRHGAAVIKYLFIIDVIIILTFYFYKVFTHKLF